MLYSLYMTAQSHGPAEGIPSVPLADARAQLSKLANLAEYTGQVTALTRYGRPVAAIVPATLLPLLAGVTTTQPVTVEQLASIRAHAAEITGTSHEENMEILAELRKDAE
jgi:prevent-host-death family protein